MSLILPFRENAGGVGGREHVLGYLEAFLISVSQGFLVAINDKQFPQWETPISSWRYQGLRLA